MPRPSFDPSTMIPALRPALAAGLCLALAAGGAQAQTPSPEQARALAETIAILGVQSGMARSLVALCDERDPARAPERRAAFEAWAAENQLPRYEALVAAMQAQEALEKAQTQTRRIVGEALAREDAVCAHAETLFDDAQMDLRPRLAEALRAAKAMGLDVAPDAAASGAEADPAPASASAANGGAAVRRLSQFSVEAMAIMAEAAPARAEMDSETRDAREARLLEALEASGGRVALYGRVTARDEMREWTEEAQSIFEVECRDFADRRHKALMEESLGQDRVVSGEAARVFDARSGTRAVLYLEDCAVSEAAAAALGDPAPEGLTRRPPSEAEAYAGPGEGIAMGEVDRVLYDASFDTRLDGFGNLYTDRRESIYVLLKDGTAYAHDWSFPFADLNVALSQRREPEKWGRWSERRGVVSLLQADGETEELEDAQRLRSPAPGARLDHEYYYLNVGMGGGRSDRGLILRPDGGMERSQGGFVAGHVAGGFMAVVGPDRPILKGRYRFEPFALVAEGEDGREDRIFFGVPEGEDLADPESVVVGGAVYWTRDDDEE